MTPVTFTPRMSETSGAVIGWRYATMASVSSAASERRFSPFLAKYFSKKGENRLSIAALETLAIVAYRQPITAPEVSDIRGVNSTGVIRTLLERRMIRVSGRKNVVGSPFLYRTTKEFLVHFGLNDIRDLPRLEEFGDLIGENINDDLVAAINAAETTTLPEELPLDSGTELPLEGGTELPPEGGTELPLDSGTELPLEGGAELPPESGTESAESPVAAEETQLESSDSEPMRD